MVNTLEECTGIKAQLEFLPRQPGDVEQTFADIDKSREILGYAPKTDFIDGVRVFVDWYRENRMGC